ncbi:hypothetical protein [Actinorugispora endophytica]|uniref:Lipoprotein n=1 Tax=Actinorugispora endophytica TaxID=1605990 RepID=A0A4R6V4K7_9ACTN|nr:hypothetical protein [Actinorugispora endophytica]TDQ53749.1 hypothetical protein EV190_103200 [Actinorugispora endophytica]
MGRGFPALTLAVILCATGCAATGDPEGSFRESTPQAASPLPTASANLHAAFEDLSGLTIPQDATDLEVAAENNSANLPVYRVRFTTSRGGAERFCTTAGFNAYRDPDAPDRETREEFGITGETIEGTVTCRGGDPGSRASRKVVVVFPSAESAVVHVIAYAFPND